MNKPPVSFEFFPPNTPAGAQKLRDTWQELNQLGPEFFSVTYGAGGAAQEKTFETVLQMTREALPVAPHLSCIGSTRESVGALLGRYRDHGIGRLVALRGDLPSGAGTRHAGDFRFACDLVAFVRERLGSGVHIEVAAYPEKHPQADSMQRDLDAFMTKVSAGANSAITQYFYNADAYLHFRDAVAARGVDIPIVAGIMPIINATQLIRFSDACGAEIPRWLRQRLTDFGDDTTALRQFGHEAVHRLCERLIGEGVPGLHFYTLNHAGPTAALCRSLELART